MRKRLIVGLFAILGLMLSTEAATSASATTSEFRLSIKHDGVRASAGEESLRYSPLWDGGSNETAKVTLSEGDTVLSENLTAEGDYAWSVSTNGTYNLTHTTYTNGAVAKVLNATFVVTGLPDPFPEGSVTVTGYNGKYDGRGHSISVATTGISSPTITYARTAAGPFEAMNPSFTNVCDETVWCVIAADGYITQTNSAKVVIAKGTIGPGGGEEPGGGEVPPGGLSKFDATAMYDGDGHTIDTNKLFAAFKGSMVGEFEIAYAVGGDVLGAPQSGLPGGQPLPWRNVPPVWTNVVATSLWYKVTSPNYNDFVHEAKVTITNRPIAFASVAPIADQTYTGSAIEPVPTVTDKRTLIGALLPTDIITTDDYAVSYADNIDVGTAKVILTGQNNYAGVVTNTFQIVPAIIPPGPGGAITATGYTNVYDGVAHDVSVTATGLKTTPTMQYRSSPTAEWQSASPTYKDVCDTQVWWKVSAPNYSDATGTIGVKITPRPVTLTSGTKTDFVYDGNPHEFSVMIISENSFATGEGVATSNWATVTTVAEGQVDNTFDYAPLEGTKLENYNISVVTGKIAVVKGTIDPKDDPGRVDPSVDPTDPEQVKDPTIRFSPWDYVGVYDGTAHTVDTNAMKAAYADKFAGNIPSFAFATASNGTYGVDAPTFKDVVATSFWYKVSAANYNDIIHPCKVIVTNRCVTMKSADGTWVYDGKEHSTNAVTVTIHGDDGAAGVRTLPGGPVPLIGDETVQTTFYKMCSEVGTVSNDFSIAWTGTAKADNYNVTLVTGKLEIVAAGAVTVTITGCVSNVVYDGTEKSVAGYDVVSISDSLYKATDFRFDGVAATNGTDAGTYPMGLAQSQFVNTNGNFATVTFNVTDGWLKIEKGTIGPGGGKEPGGGEVPPGGVSKFDATAMYDGDGHTIDTNALVAAFKGSMVGEFEIAYAVGGDVLGAPQSGLPGGQPLPWRNVPPVWTNVVTTSLWYKVTSPNYNDFVHEAKVTITNRPIALVSVAAIADQTYTGSAIEPVPTVTDKRTLIGATSPTDIITADDYTVSYADNVNVGTAKVILAGQNNYAGVVTNTFQIVPAVIPPGPSGAITATGYTNAYDGIAHGVTVTAMGLKTTPTVQYRSSPTAEWQSASPTYADVCDTQVWWKVSAPNYSDATGTIGVKITPRPVTLTSGTKTDFVYDGTPHEFSVMIISENPFVAGEGIATSNWATVTTIAEGEVPNTFDYSPLEGTKLENYNISVVTGKIAVVKGALDPEDDPGKVDPSVDPTDPEQVKDPTIRFSPWDYVGVYDGAEHTVDTNAMKAAYVAVMGEGVTVQYAVGGGTPTLPWNAVAPTFKDVVATSFWYKVSAANYEDVIHPCKVTITNRPVTVTSGTKTDFVYDGQPHAYTNLSVTVGSFVAGEGIATSNWATVTTVAEGQVDNTFDFAPLAGTKLENYDFAIVTGKIAIAQVGAVTVTITGRVSNVVYDGTEKSVSGYDVVSISDPLYKATDFRFDGVASTNGTDAGTYPMGLAQSQFVNTNGNFAAVTFNVTDGSLVIAKANHDMTGVAWNYGSPFTYDGSEKSVALTTCPATLTPNYTDNAKTAAGIYTAKVAFSYDTKNYNAPSAVADCAWEIKKGTIPPGSDPGKVDPSVDPSDPEQVKDPTIRFSPWDYVGVYDGAEHTVDTNAMKAAYVAVMGEGVTVQYAVGGGTPTLPWNAVAPTFKDVVATSFWYKVSAANYEDVIHPCKVTITNRPVTVTSRDISKTFDGTPLKVTEEDITVTLGGPTSWAAADGQEPVPPGESFVYGDFGERTAVGTSPASFSVSAGPNTKLGNYDIHCVTGTITITKGTLDPEDDPGKVDPSVDPTDPEQVKDPTIRFSPWDYVGVYDGAEHTVDTNAMKAAYVAVMGEGVTVQYAVGGGTPTLPWNAVAPTFKDVVATSFWYKVSAANYEDVIHPCKVIITNRPVTVTSRDISKTFDGTPLKVTEGDITVTSGGLIEAALPAGESFVYGDFGERTAVGTSPASFSVSAGPNTKLGNYDIHCVTGTITIVEAPVTTSKVVFDAIGGKIGIRTVVTQELESVYGTLPTATRANYLFQGWFLGVTNGAPQAVAGGALLKAGDHTLFAKWTVDPTVCDASIFAWEAIDANTARIVGFVNPNQQIAKMVIPEMIGGRFVTEIAALAFSSKKCGTTELALPTFLTTIGDRAFMSLKTTANAYSLSKITFVPVRRWDDPAKPGALTIGTYAFSSETPLKELTLPAEVVSIGNYAFANCRQMSSITILGKPAIGTTVFRNAGVDVGGVTVHIDPALAGDTDYMAQIKGGLANVTVKTDAVVTGIETAGLTMGAPGVVKLTLGVARAAAWGQVDTSAVKVEYRATLDAAPTVLAPKATENADGTVTVEVAVPQGESGFLRVEME